MSQVLFVAAIALLPLIAASPTGASPAHTAVRTAAPVITASPEWDPYVDLKKRDLLSKAGSLLDDVASDIKSLGKAAQSVVTADLTKEANFFSGVPSPDDVKSSLGLEDDQIDALPTKVLNLP